MYSTHEIMKEGEPHEYSAEFRVVESFRDAHDVWKLPDLEAKDDPFHTMRLFSQKQKRGEWQALVRRPK
jgi:hypothetical protein